MRTDRWGPYAALLALALLSLALRPPVPDDETRYLSVAWSMHLNDAWLVPLLEGRPYAHKPPLLFWLIRAGWLVFGPVDWWPRMLPALFGCGVLALGGALARRLWGDDAAPGGGGIEAKARWLILGSAGFAVFGTVLLFDVMLACFVLLGLNGLALARERRRLAGFALYALALTLGGLGKGPVILVYLAPAALLAPIWAGPQARLGWYIGLLAAITAALALCLAWALPAAWAGGEEYAGAILWGQTAGRIIEAFAHRRPVWWYLPVLPVLCLPWIVWPAWTIRWTRPDAGERLCLTAAGAGFVILSLISGKQTHYLVPLLPTLMLLLARRTGPSAMPSRAALGTLAVLVLVLAAGRIFLLPRYDLRPAATLLSGGVPVAFVGRYEGEVSWLARLRRPVVSLDAKTLPGWAEANPDGLLVVPHRRGAAEAVAAPPLHRQRYRNRELSIWPATAAPELAARLD